MSDFSAYVEVVFHGPKEVMFCNELCVWWFFHEILWINKSMLS